ncbi:MAG TPA: phosphoglycerate mutase family protein [Candidatus Dormibacteraeota bacterium]|nr:phosphoglycerate mutase family protein [Candidatus Dormibacteraeota bacterium]
MMTARRLIIIAAVLLFTLSAVAASPIIFVVRHAEKSADGNDPDLSAAGQERAEALARIVKDAEITAIFTTEFKRTQETAAPTAKELHVSPTVIPADQIFALVEKLRGLKGNGLVVGHGNTIPDLVKALGIATPVNVPENDYSELFFIILGDKPQLLRLHYPM